ncbi:hypothetical protein IJT93_05910 [bacterium]|nr:hypothetical protein [bacterium]
MPFLAYYKDPKKKKLQIIEAVLAVVGIAVMLWLLPPALEKRQRIADAVELCEFGHQMIEAGSIDAAKQSFAKAMELDPELLTPYLELGAFAYFEGEYDKEIEIYRQAIKNIPDTYHLHYILAESLFFSKDFDGAIEEIDKALILEPDNAIAKNFRARCVKYKQHPEQMFDPRKRNKERRDELLKNAEQEHHHEHARHSGEGEAASEAHEHQHEGEAQPEAHEHQQEGEAAPEAHEHQHESKAEAAPEAHEHQHEGEAQP